MHDPNDPYGALTVTVDSPITISHNDILYVDPLSGSDPLATSVPITIDTMYDPMLSGADTITLDNSVYIGSAKIDEEKIKLLDALLETINNLPEDNELRSLFENVQMINKMKNAD